MKESLILFVGMSFDTFSGFLLGQSVCFGFLFSCFPFRRTLRGKGQQLDFKGQHRLGRDDGWVAFVSICKLGEKEEVYNCKIG